MDTQAFRRFLEERKFTAAQSEAFIACAEKFLAGCEAEGGSSPADMFPSFSRRMIAEHANTRDNYYAIALYGRFTKDNALMLAALELVDGAEVLDNLYRKTGEALGERRRDEIFAGLKPAPVGTPNAEKPAAMQAMLERLEQAEPEACKEILASGLRDLPDEHYVDDQALFAQSGDIDEYLWRKKRQLLAELRQIQREGRLYFNQEITEEVIQYVRRNPEIGQGVRDGNIVYETKIPHQAKEYLAETDEDKKRYYYCHCPWVKQSLKAGKSDTPTVFCNCSAAFMKKPWEVIFGQTLQADVLETVLKRDLRCRFAIHLPENSLA
jgi:hypothetical protein